MPLIEVSFKGNRREFFNWDGEEPIPMKAAVIVEADRGEDLGFVYATGELALKRAAGVPHRPTPENPVTQAVKRTATTDEVRKVAELREQDELARRKAMERVKANNLVMKLTDAEWRWDRRKLTIFFTADKRVDFRNLVRELASLFRTRIELKQIGVRDEAKRLGGIGRCAREYCSASWLPELRPVNLGVAKDQRLSLNPTQISGACGRLMCCLRYEHEFYVQQRKRFPKEGKIIQTAKGEEKVVANDIFRERVTLRGVDGEVRIVPLAELRREWRDPSTAGQILDEDTSPVPYEAISDEVLRMQDTSEMPAWRPDLMRDGLPPRGLPVLRPSAGERTPRAESAEPPSTEPTSTSDVDARRTAPRREGGSARGAGGRDVGREGTRDGAREGRGSANAARGDDRSRPERPPRGERSERPPRTERRGERRRDDARRDARPTGPAASDDAPDESLLPTGSDAAEAPEASDAQGGSAEEQERRLRRRRGRRGGRRGRNSERGDSPSDSTGDASNDAEPRGPRADHDPAPGDGA
jgi:cell fate regulator YaaT (PSP1 superfamily)